MSRQRQWGRQASIAGEVVWLLSSSMPFDTRGIDTTLERGINSQIARALTWLCWRERSLALCFMPITSAVVNKYPLRPVER